MASLAAMKSALWSGARIPGYGGTKRRGAALGPKQAYAVQKIINRGKEKKIIDTNFSAIDTDSLPVMTKLTWPAQGLTDTTRIGDKIELIGIRLQGHVQFQVLTGHVRLILFQWQADDTVLPVVADILDASGLGAEVDHYAWNNRNKYKILWDRSFGNHSGGVNFRTSISKYVKPTRKNIIFDNAAVTATKGSIFLLSMGTGADGTDTFTMVARMYFRDS